MLAVQSQQAVAIENIGGYGILRVEPEAREFVTGETPSVTEVARTLRGGPRNSDRLLRWDPDHREGVWNVPKETELPG